MPVFSTGRLSLNPVSNSDSKDIQSAAAIREIADTMISLPHPYPSGEATRYIQRQCAETEAGHSYTFILRAESTGDFLGLIELRAIETEHSQAELSFWLAKSAWHQGYMREALPIVVEFALVELGLNRLYAYHMLRNPASGRILQKTGFRQEGLLRQRVRKWGLYEDVAIWAMLRRDWQTSQIDVQKT